MERNARNESPAAAIVTEGLTVQRGRRRVLDGIDLAIPHGQVTGLLGPSGCGKSTLMRSLVGVQMNVHGEVEVLSQPAGSAGLRRRVAYATQAVSVYDDLTVQQNLRYFERVLGAPKDDAKRVIELVGLAQRARQRVETLSGGQRGRVSLAVALLGEPELIVLDEPTVGLDPVLRAELWELFRRLADGGVTVLVSSHVMDEALRCDRLILMREGRILAYTTPDELLASTGTTDPESAFLAVIAAQDSGDGVDASRDAERSGETRDEEYSGDRRDEQYSGEGKHRP